MDISLISSLEGAWDDLERINDASFEPSPFLTVSYLEVWDRCFSHDNEKAVFVGREGGKIRGIAPFYRREHPATYFYLGGHSLSDRLGFIVEKGFESEFVDGFIHFIGDHFKQKDISFVLNNLNGNTPLSQALAERSKSDEKVELHRVESSPFVELPSTFEEYLGGLTKKHRHELRRKMKRSSENLSGIEMELFLGTEGEGFDLAMEDFIHLHSSSNARKLNFWKGKRREFFYSLADKFGKEGWLKLFFLKDAGEGKRVASLLVFDYGDEYLLYNSGFDPSHRKSSPGLVLIAECLKKAINEGKRKFDFLRGEEKYKFDLGGVDRPVFRVEFRS